MIFLKAKIWPREDDRGHISDDHDERNEVSRWRCSGREKKAIKEASNLLIKLLIFPPSLSRISDYYLGSAATDRESKESAKLPQREREREREREGENHRPWECVRGDGREIKPGEWEFSAWCYFEGQGHALGAHFGLKTAHDPQFYATEFNHAEDRSYFLSLYGVVKLSTSN